MGLGKSLKKAVKSVAKAITTPKGVAGLVAAPLTGGASLALTAKAGMNEYAKIQTKEAQKKANAAELEATKNQRRALAAGLPSGGSEAGALANLAHQRQQGEFMSLLGGYQDPYKKRTLLGG